MFSVVWVKGCASMICGARGDGLQPGESQHDGMGPMGLEQVCSSVAFPAAWRRPAALDELIAIRLTFFKRAQVVRIRFRIGGLCLQPLRRICLIR